LNFQQKIELGDLASEFNGFVNAKEALLSNIPFNSRMPRETTSQLNNAAIKTTGLTKAFGECFSVY